MPIFNPIKDNMYDVISVARRVVPDEMSVKFTQ